MQATERIAPVMRTFLFSDLRDYTAFVERQGDDAAADLLRSYREIVRASVAAHLGAEVKTEGDSFYVVFDSPSVAVNCAVAVQRALAAHEAERPERRLRVGIGLHTGETVPFDDQFVGSAVNVASRLAGKAEADEIVVSDTLRGLVRTSLSVRLTERGPLELKGVSEPIRAWRVEWREATSAAPAGRSAAELMLPPLPPPRLPTPQGDGICPSVVGREAELARLIELLEATVSGHGRTIVVGGEAGVGKSAFVRQATEAVLERGFRLLYGPTVETDTGLPYAAFIAAVRSGFRGLDRQRLGMVLTQTAPALAQLFPELAAAGARTEVAREEQHRISVAFHDLFSAFAREAPILLVLEDLHWADDATLDLLHYLSRELRDARVLVLATYRSDEMHRRHPFLRVLGAMQRERVLTEIQLKRLTPELLAELVQRTFGLLGPLTVELRDALYARSEGNPFFTEELLKALVDSGDLFRTATGWDRKPIEALRIPSSIREAVRDRIARLSIEAQDSLSAAAVIGQRFSFEILRDVRDIDDDRVLVDLKQFIDQQLVTETGEADLYAFRHALTREVVYEELLVPERKALHRKLSAALAKRPLTEPSLLATHLIAGGDLPGAVPHLLSAAKRALQAYAPREAAAHFERALEIGVAADEQPAILEQLAEALFLFDLARSVKAAERAASAYEVRSDVFGISRALVVASRSLAVSLTTQTDLQRMAALAERAVTVLDGEPESAELAWALAQLATVQYLKHDLAKAASTARRAIELGERHGNARATANAYVSLAVVLWTEDPMAARPALERGREIALAHGYTDVAWRAYLSAPGVGLVAGMKSAELRAAADEAVAYGRRHGLERDITNGMRMVYDVFAGDWDTALGREGVPAKWAETLRLQVAVGREGPDATSQSLDAARAGIDRDDATALFRFARLVVPYTLLRSRDVVRELLVAIDAGLASGREPNLLATWAVEGILAGALLLGDVRWIDRLQDSRWKASGSAFLEGWSTLYDGARALLANDAPQAVAGLGRFVELVGPIAPIPPLDMAVLFAREADLRGLDLHPFADALRAVRPTAEHARAAWLLSEIDRLTEGRA